MTNPVHQAIQEEFLAIVETYTGLKHEKLSITDEWARNGPDHLRHIPLSEYLFMVIFFNACPLCNI